MTHWNDSSQRVKKQKAYYNTNLQSKQPKKNLQTIPKNKN